MHCERVYVMLSVVVVCNQLELLKLRNVKWCQVEQACLVKKNLKGLLYSFPIYPKDYLYFNGEGFAGFFVRRTFCCAK